MGRITSHQEEEKFTRYLRSGRDEMNLLEHSISGADKKVDRTTGCLLFENQTRHPETGEPISQSWEVTFNGKFGRPTPKDDDVFVALMKVTQATNFAVPKVHFSSYQLIKILNWPDKGGSYRAIDDALNRLGGVWIVAKNYWYDNEAKEYVDAKFHIIDEVFLYERDKYDRALRKARKEGRERPLSWIRWSDVMQGSFAAGYVRKLDIEVYRSLKKPVSRKLFRYLGKHFYYSSKYSIDIQELCHEKLGYPKYDNNTCKNKLRGALNELVENGVYGMSYEFNSRYGKCEVVFRQGKTKKSVKQTECPLVMQLLEIGIARNDAKKAVARHSSERILEDIEAVQFRKKKGLIKTNPAGLLHSMLQSEEPWGRPEGFVSSIERERRRVLKQKQKLEEQKEDVRRNAEAKAEAYDAAKKLRDFLESLGGEAEQEAFFERSLSTFRLRGNYQRAVRDGDEVSIQLYRQSILEHGMRLAQSKDAA